MVWYRTQGRASAVGTSRNASGQQAAGTPSVSRGNEPASHLRKDFMTLHPHGYQCSLLTIQNSP